MVKKLELIQTNIEIKNISLADINHLKNFQCGNSSMQIFLECNAYYYHITREASTTLFYYQNELAAYFTLQRSSPSFDLSSIEGVEKHHTHVLDLARLAVSSKFQSKGLGTFILKYITDMAYKVNDRFITTDALYERWEWYKNLGFHYLKEEEIKGTSGNGLVYMLMDLYDSKLIEEYFNE